MVSRYCKLIGMMVCVAFMSAQTIVFGRGILPLSEVLTGKREEPEIKGARVSQPKEAMYIALKASSLKKVGIDAREGPGSATIIELGFDVNAFAAKGDKIWEVRSKISEVFTGGYDALRSILWVHPDTGEAFYVCGPWINDDDTPPVSAATHDASPAEDGSLPSKIAPGNRRIIEPDTPHPDKDGEKIQDGAAAARLAEKAYVKKMKVFEAHEKMEGASPFQMGFDLRDFAKRGDTVWEVHVTAAKAEGSQALRAILWVHQDTGRTFLVCGPWEEKEDR